MTVLQETVRSSIDHLFETLEKLHGKILVSRALAYLTLAHNGATEAELEDILSCDDDVLNDVYMYWTPPVRRLPPLLLVRIRTDLSQYLVERGADGARVLYWYHRQFIEAAEARYCADEVHNTLIHSNLADFFNGTWANGRKKPYSNLKGGSGEEDRHVATQQLKFGEKEYNLRALNNLPYHRTKAKQEGLLQKECLANIHFLMNKVEALSITEVVDDFSTARKVFPENNLFEAIYESLLLSQKGIGAGPGQLVPQLLGRLEENNVTRRFIQEMKEYPRIYLEPDIRILERPGGQLVHCISAHRSDLDMMDMTRDGRHVITVCQADKEVSIWDVKDARLKRELMLPGQCVKAIFCNGDKWIAVEKDKILAVEDVNTGKSMCEIRLTANLRDCVFCAAGKDKHLLLVFTRKTCNVYDLHKEGQLVNTASYPDKITFGTMSVPYGSDNYCAVCDDDQNFITVLDLNTMVFRKKFRGFESRFDEDGEEETFEVDMVAIHPDETYLAYTSMMNGVIAFADFDGNVLRKTAGDESRNYRSIDFTLDGSYFYIFDSNHLRLFETKSLEEIDSLEHSKDVLGACTRDLKTVVTIDEGSNLRIWDLTRKKQDPESETVDSGDLKRISSVIRVHPLDSPRYALIFGQPEKKAEEYALGVFDYVKEKFVRYRKMLFEDSPKLNVVQGRRAVIMMARKLMVINLDTMEIQATLQGCMGSSTYDHELTKRNQLICLSKGSKNIKIHSPESGKVDFILKAGQAKKIASLKANREGTIVCCTTDEGPMFLFDLKNRKYLYEIPNIPSYGQFFGNNVLINDDGTRLLFSIDSPLPGFGAKSNDVEHLLVWDIEKRKEMCRMYDVAYEKKYRVMKSDEMTSLEEAYFLDGNRILTTNVDNIMRIYDMNSGKLLCRLIGHTTMTKVSLHDKSPYILSYGYSNEEDCIRLWDKQTYEQLASFTFDKSVNTVNWDATGKFFFSCVPRMIKWKIQFGNEYVSNLNINSLPESFENILDCKTLKVDVTAANKKKAVPEEGDPDTDPEIPSSDEEEDDD